MKSILFYPYGNEKNIFVHSDDKLFVSPEWKMTTHFHTLGMKSYYIIVFHVSNENLICIPRNEKWAYYIFNSNRWKVVPIPRNKEQSFHCLEFVINLMGRKFNIFLTVTGSKLKWDIYFCCRRHKINSIIYHLSPNSIFWVPNKSKGRDWNCCPSWIGFWGTSMVLIFQIEF